MRDPIQLLKDYVHFPSISADSSCETGMKGAREFAAKILSELGFVIEMVPTPKHAILLAKRKGNSKYPHVLFYGHYDVQPADPLDLWTSPPFEAQVRGERLYGRGAADNKGPQVVQFMALAKLLEKYPDLPLPLTFLIEGEEEIGSPSFSGFLKSYRNQLQQADFVLLSDTGCPSPEQLVITVGLRGMIALEVTVLGPRRDLHSGFGGSLMNPIQALTEICGSLHDSSGFVNLPGFYDAVVEPVEWEREELKKYPVSEEAYQEFLGVPSFHCPPGQRPLESSRFWPTLEFNGIGGGYQGEGSKTIIPSKGFVKISCRLVPNQNPKEIMKLLQETITKRCPPGVTLQLYPVEGGCPYCVIPPGHPNTPSDQSPVLAKAFQAAEGAIEHAFGRKPLYLREGGSIPIIGQIKQEVGLDSIMIGLSTPEDNLHAPDESFHLGILSHGTEVYLHTLESLSKIYSTGISRGW